MIFDSKKIPYNKLDIAADEALKEKMRRVMGDPKGLAPQMCMGEQYLGVSRVVLPLLLSVCHWCCYCSQCRILMLSKMQWSVTS